MAPHLRVWLAAGALVAGTVTGDGGASARPGLVCASVGMVLLGLRRRRGALLIGLALVAFGLGALNASVRFAERGPLNTLARDVPECEVSGRVLEDIRPFGTLVELHALTCPEVYVENAGVAITPVSFAPAGAPFRGTGFLLPLGDGEFDRARWRAGAQAVLDLTSSARGDVPAGIFGAAHGIRRGLRAATLGLDPERAALLRGLTIGDTRGLGVQTMESLRRAGLTHLVAVSGSNVAIVLGAVALATRWIAHRLRLVAGAGALVLFLVIVGPDPSVLRAGAMGAIALVALVYGRRTEPLAALGVALIAVIGHRPAMAFSAGLHLSAAATAGIVLFAAPLERTMSRIVRPVRLLLAATLAAQIGVMPVLLLVFGELSLVSPLANLLALPVVPLATVVAFACGAAAPLFPGTRVVMRTVEPCAAWILEVARRLGEPEWAAAVLDRRWGWVALAAVTAAGAVVLRPSR